MPSPGPLYRPDETQAEIFSEHTWLQGAFLACVAYGMQAILFVMCVRFLWTARKSENLSWNTGLAVYVTVMFILSTLYMAGLLEFTQESFIDARNIPGGPNAYEDMMYSIPIDMLANIWRCFVIYQASRVSGYTAIALPAVMSLASLVLGILWLKQVGTVSASPWDTPGINYTTPYFAMSLALNILVTLLIVVRLMLHRNRINQTRAMGTNHGAQYTSFAAMIIESAAIYSIFSLLFLVPFTMGHPLSQLFLQALSPVQIMSTLLIIFRIAQGKGWSHQTAMVFTEGLVTQTVGGTKWNNTQIDSTTGDDSTPASTRIDKELQVLTEARTVDFDRTMMVKSSAQDV
ncbi:hypothetical protein C8R44DRAFT_750620 [Mycena epipterygia]|nr:hypothetical protein C8R44DRAFT_750620 [Mycena epipterygia]